MSTEQVHHWFGCLYEQEMMMVMVTAILENRKEKRAIQAVQVRTHFSTPRNTTDVMHYRQYSKSFSLTA